MADLVYIAVTIAFFALCGAYVRACDRLTPDTQDRPEAGRGGAS
jgi:hypothetical protein